jgi:hypothetical protein
MITLGGKETGDPFSDLQPHLFRLRIISTKAQLVRGANRPILLIKEPDKIHQLKNRFLEKR